jgi:hypothetical protein
MQESSKLPKNRPHPVPEMREMAMVLFRNNWTYCFVIVGLTVALTDGLRAQECYSGPEIDAATAKALQAAAHQYFEMSAQGNVAGLKANAVPEVESNFGNIERAVVNHRALFAQGQPSETRIFLLDASNSKTVWQRADFYCGIYNSPDRTGISIPNLPPGRYALTIAKVMGQDPATLTMILAEAGNSAWKLAGYYARANSLGGHDGQWYVAKAREYKEKGQLHNAWFYYLTAWDLLAPVDFISTPTLDKLSDETQAARPRDLPSQSAPLELTTAGRTFRVIELSAVPVNGELYVRVAYDSASTGNPTMASADNRAVMKALLAKYPEIRDAFPGVVARAVDGSGRDYATLTSMKDLK